MFVKNVHLKTIKICGRQYDIQPEKEYNQAAAIHYLRTLAPDLFVQTEIKEASMRYMEAKGDKVLGSKIVSLMEELGGEMIVLSKNARRKFRETFDQSNERIGWMLDSPEVSQYIRSMPFAPEKKYILKTNEKDFTAAMRKQAP